MKIRQSNKVHCHVNGCELAIPTGMPIVSVNMYGSVQAWFQKPYMTEGIWKSDTEEGVFICSADLEENDVWTHLFSVLQNRFLTYNDCE
jgi:hypothetical protein